MARGRAADAGSTAARRQQRLSRGQDLTKLATRIVPLRFMQVDRRPGTGLAFRPREISASGHKQPPANVCFQVARIAKLLRQIGTFESELAEGGRGGEFLPPVR